MEYAYPLLIVEVGCGVKYACSVCGTSVKRGCDDVLIGCASPAYASAWSREGNVLCSKGSQGRCVY
jgi:hypothetical protein